MEDVNMNDISQPRKDSDLLATGVVPDANRGRSERIENQIIQNILLITADVRNLEGSGPAAAVALPSGSSFFNLESVVHPFFERMLMTPAQLQTSLVQNPTGKWINRFGRADQEDVVAYLGECYIRLQQERRGGMTPAVEAVFQQLEELILQNLRLGFQVPDLVAPQDFARQLVAFYFTVMDQQNENMTTLIHKFFEKTSEDFNEEEISASILFFIHEKTKKFTLMNMQEYENVVQFILIFSLNLKTAKLFLDFCTPKNNFRDAVFCEHSLLGRLLRLSCLPEHNDIPPEFFVSRNGISLSEIENSENFIFRNTKRATESVFSIINNIVRQSNELRSTFLHWVSDCLSANFGRAKMWQPNVQFQIRLASDGFVLNLSTVLLKLCRPFVNPTGNSKILKIHPLFPASGVYLRKMPEETTLIPKENLPAVSPPTDFNFITSCFFLCHEALRLGWGVVWERFGKLNKHLSEVESRLDQARAARSAGGAGGGTGGVGGEVEEIEQAIHQMASRHLSMKAALTVPSHMELMIEFSVCTATWLSQMAVQPSIYSTELPTTYLPLFPSNSEAEVPIQLAYIPELLVENVIEILTCNHRLPFTTGSTMDWKYQWMVELMNMVLVFMPCPQRMKNPHLRAKMAMMMHNMMPHKRFADTYQERDSRHSLALELLDVPKERLFKEHPNKEEFLEAILNIFVSIEMAGSNLRFGEAFHYRRPLYALMEYLFTLDDHKQRVEELAAAAVPRLQDPQPPLFLRFLNLLFNDATYMLEGGLDVMAKIKKLEEERLTWTTLPKEQQEEKERDYQQQGDTARYYNILGRETIQCLKTLTKFRNPSRILLNNVMVNRLASLLNYSLHCLVGADRRAQYKVKDFSKYSFEPKKIVGKICQIYVNLSSHDACKELFKAILKDERSYSERLFEETICVLKKFISESGNLIEGIEELWKNVRFAEKEENEKEELLREGEVPEEFLDPLMADLMSDPVRLPSSGQIVDRSTIARILLSEQSDPFNRQPLTMDQVQPADELRKEIETWLQKLRDAKARRMEL